MPINTAQFGLSALNTAVE